MEFLMEKNNNKGHHVTIHIPKIKIKNAVLKELINISQKTNINGFRKGKVPIHILQEKYGNNVYYDVFNRLMQKFFYKFVNKEKIKIIGSPKYHIHDDQNNEKEYFKYSVNYELYPKIQIKNLTSIKAKKINIILTKENVKNIIAKRRENKEIWKTVNSSIKMNNRVTIDYSIYENNHIIEKFNLKNIVFVVSKNTFLSQLNNKIINRCVNDIIFFKIKFYKFFPEKELQNKEITFKIKIKKIEKKYDIELEEEKINHNKTKELYQSHYQNIKKYLNKQIQSLSKKYFQDQIMKQIIKENSILIPPRLLKEEIKILYENNIQEYTKNQSNLLEKKYHVNLELKAIKILSIQIIIESIIFDNKLSVDEKTIKSLIKEISLNYKNPLKIINLYNTNQDLKNSLKNVVLEMKVMDFLKNHINVIKELWTFDQFMNYKWEN